MTGLRFSHVNAAFAIIVLAVPAAAQNASRRAAPLLTSRSAPVIEQGGLRFRDLDRNGKLDPYEDWRLTPAARARDLVARMTLEEKAGAVMHGTARNGGAMGAARVGTGHDTAADPRPIPPGEGDNKNPPAGGAPGGPAPPGERA